MHSVCRRPLWPYVFMGSTGVLWRLRCSTGGAGELHSTGATCLPCRRQRRPLNLICGEREDDAAPTPAAGLASALARALSGTRQRPRLRQRRLVLRPCCRTLPLVVGRCLPPTVIALASPFADLAPDLSSSSSARTAAPCSRPRVLASGLPRRGEEEGPAPGARRGEKGGAVAGGGRPVAAAASRRPPSPFPSTPLAWPSTQVSMCRAGRKLGAAGAVRGTTPDETWRRRWWTAG